MFQWNKVYSVVVTLCKYHSHSLNLYFTQNSLKWLRWWWKWLGKKILTWPRNLLVWKVTLYLESNSENTEDHRAIINLWYFLFSLGTFLARTAEQATLSFFSPFYLLEHQFSQACDLLSILWMVQDVFFDKECLNRIKLQSKTK